ncbi:unnamed protein product [Caenorhabditis angaria]|uniref:CUB domain-containing protein n=1 Tax=Caenorhabditis angaria TaxID=860376 RepID=A0A9P1N548_9PELO|nr:unnamed protein product [Caenorhabditis angaria]
MLRLLLSLIFVIFISSVDSSRCKCVEKIVLLHNLDDFRIIASPEYPRPYCQSMDCIWKIVAPDNSSKAYFYADNLDLREDDQILFYDFPLSTENGNENDTHSHSCTSDEICRFASSNQYMTIRFKTSPGFIEKYGFQGIVSAKDKPVYALLSALQAYCLPLTVLFLILLGVFVSIICCKRNSINSPHISSRDEEKLESQIFLE